MMGRGMLPSSLATHAHLPYMHVRAIVHAPTHATHYTHPHPCLRMHWMVVNIPGGGTPADGEEVVDCEWMCGADGDLRGTGFLYVCGAMMHSAR